MSLAALMAEALRDGIELRFTPRNVELVRLGIKHATTRRSRHGSIGSKFLVGGRIFEILAIHETTLGKAAQEFYFLEGESGTGSFLDWWARAYEESPATLDLSLPVFVHVFLPAAGCH